jgi:mRNA-degrading endonuclease RelE of RelBE toxin-antitoxin system
LELLATLENPLRHKDVRALEGRLLGLYRLRIGEYRVIFELGSDEAEIVVYAVVPRGKAY